MSACPCSSKAITTTAAPISRMVRAWARNVASPSLRLMELTIGRPCTCFSAVSMARQSEESIISGTRATSGSTASRDMNAAISLGASSMASSMLMSITCAPASTCERAISTASSIEPSLIRRKNLRLPATLQRSPMLRKLRSGDTSSGSRPARVSVSGAWGIGRVAVAAAALAISAVWSGVVPQHPPTILSLRDMSIGRNWAIIFSGVSSYCPISFGNPALGYALMATGYCCNASM